MWPGTQWLRTHLPDNVTALADALERVPTESALSARFGAVVRARIAEEFAFEVVLSQLQSLFRPSQLPEVQGPAPVFRLKRRRVTS